MEKCIWVVIIFLVLLSGIILEALFSSGKINHRVLGSEVKGLISIIIFLFFLVFKGIEAFGDIYLLTCEIVAWFSTGFILRKIGIWHY